MHQMTEEYVQRL